MKYGRSVTCCADRPYPPVTLADSSPYLMNLKPGELISAWFAGMCRPPKKTNVHPTGNLLGERCIAVSVKIGTGESRDPGLDPLPNPRIRRIILLDPGGYPLDQGEIDLTGL